MLDNINRKTNFVMQCLFVTKGTHLPTSVKQAIIQIGHRRKFSKIRIVDTFFLMLCFIYDPAGLQFALLLMVFPLICCFWRNNIFLTLDWNLWSITFKSIFTGFPCSLGKWPIFSVLCFHMYKKEDNITSFFPILSSVLTVSSLGLGLLSLINCMYVQCLSRQDFKMPSNICLFFHTSGNAVLREET